MRFKYFFLYFHFKQRNELAKVKGARAVTAANRRHSTPANAPHSASLGACFRFSTRFDHRVCIRSVVRLVHWCAASLAASPGVDFSHAFVSTCGALFSCSIFMRLICNSNARRVLVARGDLYGSSNNNHHKPQFLLFVSLRFRSPLAVGVDASVNHL